jgi:uncharacterized protein with PIN domain
MLGKLCKWLRIMGYDAELVPHDARDVKLMLLNARNEKSVILTREKSLFSHKDEVRIIFFIQQHWRLQLKHLFKELGMIPEKDKFFTKCLICNEELKSISKEEISETLPESVLERNHEFSRCPNCLKIYWHGTHLNLALKEIEEIIK